MTRSLEALGAGGWADDDLTLGPDGEDYDGVASRDGEGRDDEQRHGHAEHPDLPLLRRP